MLKSVTLREIAARLNTSHTTVSKALRKDPKISTVMRKRVHDMAEEMGYVPNPMVSALMQHRAAGRPAPAGSGLAVLHGSGPRRSWSSESMETFARIYDGITETAVDLGYGVTEVVLQPDSFDSSLRSTLHMLRTRGIRGIILFGLPRPLHMEPTDWEDFAAVEINYSSATGALDTITADQAEHAFVATSKVIEAGSTQPGLILGQALEPRVVRAFQSGYRQACAEAKVPAHCFTDADLSDVREQIHTGQLDGIVNISTTQPGNVKSLPHTCLDLRESWQGTVAGIDQHHRTTGAVAVQRVVGLILRNQYGLPENPLLHLVPGKWIPSRTDNETPVFPRS